MADIYYQAASGYGVTDNPESVPPGAVIIDEATYTAALAAWQTAQNNTATAQLNQRKADYTTVYAALRSMGMPVAAATLLAKSVGDTPAVDPELNVKPMAFASPPVTFTHALGGATGVFEKVTEVADVTVTESGLYQVEWTIYGTANIPAVAGNSGQVTSITYGAVYKNGVIVAGTEVVPATLQQGPTAAAATWAEPAGFIQGSAGGSQWMPLNAGDVLSIWGARSFSGIAGSAGSIVSNTNGRTNLSAVRIRPA